jgi:hypothetical protein
MAGFCSRIFSPNVVVEYLTLLHRMLEVPRLTLSPHISHPEGNYFF